MKQLNVHIEGYNFFIGINIFQSNKQMIKAANDYLKEQKENATISGANAIWFESDEIKEIVKDFKIFRELGKIFFCKNSLNYGTIAHECLHATIHFCKEIVGISWSLDTVSNEQEEFFVTLYTDILESVLSSITLKKYKIK
jgi:hypothetical protein